MGLGFGDEAFSFSVRFAYLTAVKFLRRAPSDWR